LGVAVLFESLCSETSIAALTKSVSLVGNHLGLRQCRDEDGELDEGVATYPLIAEVSACGDTRYESAHSRGTIILPLGGVFEQKIMVESEEEEEGEGERRVT